MHDHILFYVRKYQIRHQAQVEKGSQPGMGGSKGGSQGSRDPPQPKLWGSQHSCDPPSPRIM